MTTPPRRPSAAVTVMPSRDALAEMGDAASEVFDYEHVTLYTLHRLLLDVQARLDRIEAALRNKGRP